MKDNGNIVFSTTADAEIGATSFNRSDLVEYDPMSGIATVLLEGSDSDVFDAVDVQLNGAYIRVDPADATGTVDTFVVSADAPFATIGDGGDPVNGTLFTHDDIVQLDREAGPIESEKLFVGDLPLGVFTTADSNRTLNAIHLIEDGYHGHFSIAQSQAGSTCAAGKITISKHEGLTHGLDTDYTGGILINSDSGTGDWSVDTGLGTLANGTIDDGAAIYTFVPGDGGQVTLNFTLTNPTSFNVNVSNGITAELASEDPNFSYSDVVTSVTYRDEFTAAAFGNNDGSTSWDADWIEIDGFNGISAGSGAGPSTGNVQIVGGKMSLTSNSDTDGNFQPSLAREANLSFYSVTETTFLNFDYTYASLNLTDEITVEVSDDGGANYTTLATYTGLTTNASPTVASLDITNVGGTIDDFTGNIRVRFRVSSGFVTGGTFFIDNAELATGTTDCGIGVMHHYHISHNSSGIACVASTITIAGHDANHFPSAPGNTTAINLSTNQSEGTWASVLTGGGVLTDIGTEFAPTNTDGLGSYTFFGDEEFVQLQFNYTSPAVNGEVVNFNIGGEFSEQGGDHDPDINFDQVGLLFFDEVGGSSTNLPIQIAGKPSVEAPVSGNITLQLIRSIAIGGENPAVACESMIPDQTTATIQFAGVCEDPGTCAAANMSFTDVLAAPQTVPVFGTGTVNPAASGQSVDVLFENQPTIVDGRNNIGATLNFTYPDAGKISLHAQFDIPFDDDISGTRSGDTVENASATFIVRPFGFDVDFGDDRLGGGTGSLANNANGPAFARAGAGFDTTVSAVAWVDGTDDSDDDGIPDFGADLSNNPVTTNFGQETGITGGHKVLVSVVTDDPAIPGIDDNPGVPGGQLGQIVQGAIFDSFASGLSTHSIAIDEVGIFDLRAQLVQTADEVTPEVYFKEVGSQNVDGGVANVGRIYPFNFELTNSSFGPRVNQAMACVATSPFTYMGEDFGVSFQINAKNAQGFDTQNYIGDFAKLTSFAELDIRAIQDVVGFADNDLTGTRLVNSTMSTTFGGGWTNGILNLMGDLNISRQASNVEDGPFVGLQIAFAPIDDNDDGSVGGNADNDVLLDAFDVDLDTGATEGTDTFKLISSHEFRYGRMLLDNAFGPETEPLDIPLRVEYWDGSQFITNVEDDCTTIFYNVTESTPADRTMTFVTAAGSYEAPLSDGDTEIEASEGSDVTLQLFNGVMARQQDGDNIDTNDPDRPFLTSAPGEGNEGSVIVEFDLGDGNLPTSLNFLQYDWRTPGDVEEETEDGTYTDNPRSRLEFGSFRSHDRVINWQEIYIAPTP